MTSLVSKDSTGNLSVPSNSGQEGKFVLVAQNTGNLSPSDLDETTVAASLRILAEAINGLRSDLNALKSTVSTISNEYIKSGQKISISGTYGRVSLCGSTCTHGAYGANLMSGGPAQHDGNQNWFEINKI
jgi:hypothetical protein